MKTVSCIPGISQQKTFNYSWLSCPFILWLKIFTVKKPSKSDNVNFKKNIQFLQLLYENTFSKILFKGKVIECIFDISLLIHDFFFFTNAWPHTSEDITMQFYQLLGNYPFHSRFFFLLFSKANSCFHLFIHNYETCRS